MLWVPPAIYKSSCTIDVQYFPFDEQTCSLIFGSWTYDENELIFALDQMGIDLGEYATSSIWDLVEAPATLRMHKSRIEFRIRIRRKPLFYTVVLLIPTVLMAFLSMMVFYLPAGAGEKFFFAKSYRTFSIGQVTLTISVLLSLVVFLLLVSKILPPTSITIPLMAKYLLLTFVLNIITILVTVIIINVFFRGPTTHRMPPWVQTTFLEFLPRILCMKRPKDSSRKWRQAPNGGGPCTSDSLRSCASSSRKATSGQTPPPRATPGVVISGVPTVVLQTFSKHSSPAGV
uniref:Uncharacterized protein n=1 Tax=Romanomermis culicivorax TaxID=13658 RepID=A0A915HM19_ROMCU